jgi:SAM-dependent methyltransferase
VGDGAQRPNLQSHNSVLDAGCNTAWFTRHAEAIAKHVVGLDIDLDSLNFARSHSVGRAVQLKGRWLAA